LIASGALAETLSRLDLPAAHLDDAGALITAIVAQHDDDYHLTRLEFTGGILWVGRVNQAPGFSGARPGAGARREHSPCNSRTDRASANIIAARISDIQDEGADKIMVRMTLADDQVLLSRITRRSHDLLGLSVGMDVFAQIKSVVLDSIKPRAGCYSTTLMRLFLPLFTPPCRKSLKCWPHLSII